MAKEVAGLIKLQIKGGNICPHHPLIPDRALNWAQHKPHIQELA